jgi:hypothetical protein
MIWPFSGVAVEKDRIRLGFQAPRKVAAIYPELAPGTPRKHLPRPASSVPGQK